MWISKGVVREVNSEKWSCKVKFIIWISKSEFKKESFEKWVSKS